MTEVIALDRGIREADPSALTVAMLDKALANLREVYDGRLAERAEAVRTLHEDMVRVPTLLDRAVASLKEAFDDKIHCQQELRDGKFASIDIKFEERDKREERLAEAGKEALAAALTSAKELVTVQNTNFAAQFSELKSSFSTQINSVVSQVTDLKDRLALLEGQLHGGQSSKDDSRDSIVAITGVVSAVVAVGALIATLGTIAFHSTAFPLMPPPAYYIQPPSISAPAVPGKMP